MIVLPTTARTLQHVCGPANARREGLECAGWTEDARRRRSAQLGEVVELVAQARLAEGGRGIDQYALADGLPAEQHPVGHGVTVGQRDLDRPLPVADADGRGNHVPAFAL